LLGSAVALEEQTTAGGSYEQANILVRTGGELFYGGELAGLRVVTLVALAAAAVVLLLRHRLPWQALRGPDVSLVLALTLLTITTAFAATGDPRGSLTAASPWAVIGCGVVIGRQYARNARLRRRAEWTVAAIVVGKAVLGLFVFVTDRGLYDPNGLLSIVYFDGAMPMVASVVLVVLLITRRAGSALVPAAVVAASAVVIVVAMRRTSVVAILATVVVVSLLGRHRQALGRLWAGGALAVAVIAVALPAAFVAFTTSLGQAWSTVLAGEGESSAQGHVDDIRIAWDTVKASPLRGLGYGQDPPVGLVTSDLSERLYVHNELFQNWLQLGLAGALLSTALVAVLFLRAVRVLREGGGDPLTLAAAVLCIGLPFALAWFPHLTTTFRWPILVGISSGLLFGERAARPSAPTSADRVGKQEHPSQGRPVGSP
jgi:O-antigen ligase